MVLAVQRETGADDDGEEDGGMVDPNMEMNGDMGQNGQMIDPYGGGGGGWTWYNSSPLARRSRAPAKGVTDSS